MLHSRNQAIAAEFQRIADDLERQQANPFRVRAYRRAAKAIGRLTQDAGAMAHRGELTRIKGIGADLARKVDIFCQYGRLDLHADDEALPAVVISWATLPGFSASLVRYLYYRLHINTVEDLETLVRSRFLRTLPEVTATEEEILASIARMRSGDANLT
jgi:DNA polymerase (family 10)